MKKPRKTIKKSRKTLKWKGLLELAQFPKHAAMAAVAGSMAGVLAAILYHAF